MASLFARDHRVDLVLVYHAFSKLQRSSPGGQSDCETQQPINLLLLAVAVAAAV